jgi:hypothetical protein
VVLARLRVHAGSWAVVGLLAAAAGVLAAGAVPLAERTSDEALRLMVEGAPSYLDRDLVLSRRLREAPPSMAELTGLAGDLPAELRDVTEVVWGIQRSQVALADGVGARLTGPGVSTAPHGVPPVISFHAQTGLAGAASLVAGRAPASDETGVEVMVAAGVAEVLQVQAGGEYVAVTAGRVGHEVPVRVSGVFSAEDTTDPVWAGEPLLLETALTPVGASPTPPSAIRAVLVTDDAGMRALARPRLLGALRRSRRCG